ncbi:MAG TPA: hypothetical protein VF202_02655 [Trueperaceae bacterium]
MPTTARPGARVALALALTLASAAARSPLEPLGPLPASADPLREDLALLATRVSDEAALRLAQVQAARDELDLALWDPTVALEASPEAEYELDLLAGQGGWDAGFEAFLELGAERDEDRLLAARAALAAAEGRYRAQLRADLRQGLLALSQERLARRELADAEAEAAAASAALAEAQAAGATEQELAALEVEAGLADVELERRRLAYRPREALLAELGVAGASASADAYLAGPVPPGVERASPHREAAALRIAAERADLAVRELPFQSLPELEVTASYRDGGFSVGAELGLRRGVPTADARLGWSSGDDDRALRFGVSASLLFSNGSSSRSTLVLAERELALRALAEFEAAQPARERESLALLELAYEELHLLLAARDEAAAALEAALAEGRDTDRLAAAARRAEDAAERAWQRYVRALFDYLETTDAVLGGA